MALGRGIPLAPSQKEQTGHLCAATTAGLGTLLRLPVATIYHALNQAVLISHSPRQTRKGEMTSWKAFVPGHSGKLAIDAIDRAMRGEASPSPAYEGEKGVIAYMLDGPDACYHHRCWHPASPWARFSRPSRRRMRRSIMPSLHRPGSSLRRRRPEPVREAVVRTNSTVHNIVGRAPTIRRNSTPMRAARRWITRSHNVAVALEDGWFHHERSTPERAHRPGTIALWRKVRSVLDLREARHRQAPPERPSLGGRLELHLDDGRVITGEKQVADAQVGGLRTMDKAGYEQKFRALAGPVLDAEVLEAFLALAHQLPSASPEAVCRLNPVLPRGKVRPDRPDGKGIYDHELVSSTTCEGRAMSTTTTTLRVSAGG